MLPAQGDPGTDSATGVPSYAGMWSGDGQCRVEGNLMEFDWSWNSLTLNFTWNELKCMERMNPCWKNRWNITNARPKLSRMCSSGAWPCALHAHTSRSWNWEGSCTVLHNLLLSGKKTTLLQVAERTLFFWNTATWPPWDGADRDYMALQLETTNQNTNKWHAFQFQRHIAKRGPFVGTLWSIQAFWFRGGDQILHHSHNTLSSGIVKESTMPRTTSWNWSMRTARRAVWMARSISVLS